MRRLIEVQDRGLAHRLSDALRADDIETEVRDDESPVEVWVRDDADLPRAREVADEYMADPAGHAARERAGANKRKAREAKDRRWKQQVALAQRSVHGVGARPALTFGLGAAAAVVTLASGFGRNRALVDALVLTTYPAMAGLVEVGQGEVWRLLTPALLHFDLLHLGFNLWMWFVFGRVVEERKGLALFLPLVIAADAGGFLAQWAWTWLVSPGSYAYAGGLSGIVYGLFGYVWLKGRIDPLDGMQIPQQTTYLLLAWLLVGFTGLLGLANGAHVGGLVVGLLWALGDVGWYRTRRRMNAP